jgi:hypothetical protein
VDIYKQFYFNFELIILQDLFFWVENFEARLDVCLHVTTYSIKSGTSLNFIQEYVGIRLNIESTFLYL